LPLARTHHQRLAKRAVEHGRAKVAVALEKAAARAHAELFRGALALGVDRDRVDLHADDEHLFDARGGAEAAHLVALPGLLGS
jgi:hypothetical protein